VAATLAREENIGECYSYSIFPSTAAAIASLFTYEIVVVFAVIADVSIV
jgi:hypothetical protein